LEELINKITHDIQIGYPNIAIKRLLDSWDSTVAPLLDVYYQEEKKKELIEISQRYNANQHQGRFDNDESLRVEVNRIVHSIMHHLEEIKDLAETDNSEIKPKKYKNIEEIEPDNWSVKPDSLFNNFFKFLK
jgi:hypothetical protein